MSINAAGGDPGRDRIHLPSAMGCTCESDGVFGARDGPGSMMNPGPPGGCGLVHCTRQGPWSLTEGRDRRTAPAGLERVEIDGIDGAVVALARQQIKATALRAERARVACSRVASLERAEVHLVHVTVAVGIQSCRQSRPGIPSPLGSARNGATAVQSERLPSVTTEPLGTRLVSNAASPAHTGPPRQSKTTATLARHSLFHIPVLVL